MREMAKGIQTARGSALIIIRAVIGVLLVASILTGAAILFGPLAIVRPVCAAAIAIALGNVIVLALMVNFSRQRPDLSIMGMEIFRQATVTIGTLLVGTIGLNAILSPQHPIYPKGVGTPLLLVAVIVISMASFRWVWTYYRPGQ